MEKILLAINAVNPGTNTLDFACYLARLTQSKVTGIFLENFVAEEMPVLKQQAGITYMNWEADEKADDYKDKMAIIEKNIFFFKEKCTSLGVSYNIHLDRGVPIFELIDESLFADLLVVDAKTSINLHYEESLSEFVKNILKKAKCPVVIAPEKFEIIDEIIFAYDGSASSIFAIKQFTYLFPQVQHRKVSIIQVNEKGEWIGLEKQKLGEWMKEHYAQFQFEAVKGNADTKLLDYLCQRKNIFLVMGAYGRNTLSQFFKPSHADLLIKTIAHPIFITHL